MSFLAAPQDANNTRTLTAPLWKAVLFRAMVALLFGIITVFWGSPDTLGLCLHLTWYFLVLAATQFVIVRRLGLPRTDPRRLALLAAAAVLVVSAVVIFIAASTTVAIWFGAAALVLLGAAELFAGLFGRKAAAEKATSKSSLRSDWLISGVIGVGAGVLLPVVTDAGPHGLLGVAGGGALMTGALWTLSALSLRHDARSAKQK